MDCALAVPEGVQRTALAAPEGVQRTAPAAPEGVRRTAPASPAVQEGIAGLAPQVDRPTNKSLLFYSTKIKKLLASSSLYPYRMRKGEWRDRYSSASAQVDGGGEA